MVLIRFSWQRLQKIIDVFYRLTRSFFLIGTLVQLQWTLDLLKQSSTHFPENDSIAKLKCLTKTA